MIVTLEEKLLSLAAVLLFALAMFLYGMHVGGHKVQAKWDVANAAQTVAAVASSEAARTAETKHATAFNDATTHYLEVTRHVTPSLAQGIPAALAAGTLRLSGECSAPAGSGVSRATAASRARDAAATQALADRVKNSIAAVQAGDDSDAREQYLRARIELDESLLKAERQ